MRAPLHGPGLKGRGSLEVFLRPELVALLTEWVGGLRREPVFAGRGQCTLACCKPGVRASAGKGDIIVGLSPRCERIVYAMRVESRMTLDEYWRDSEFRAKRPSWKSRDVVERVGDNIYEPDGEGGFVQHRSVHRTGPEEDLLNRSRDLSCQRVLAGRVFWYYGGEGPVLLESLGFLRVTRAHRCRFAPAEVQAVAAHFESLPRGVHGVPGQWAFPKRPNLKANEGEEASGDSHGTDSAADRDCWGRRLCDAEEADG